MLSYTAKIRKQRKGGYWVEFPDLPGCLTEGETLPLALENAKEALSGWLASHCDRLLDVPQPKSRRGGSYYSIEVPIQIEFAIRLRKLRHTRRITQTEMAKRLGISQQAYAKFEIPQGSNLSLSTIQRICEALEVRIEFKWVA